MRLKAHAKINWSLEVTGTRADGYHELDMVMQRIALHDTLTLHPSSKLSLKVHGSEDVPHGQENLAFHAARLLKAATGTMAGAGMTLVKRIPAGSGLGGGSADAAATLIGLNRLWNTGYSMDQLRAIALDIGADVPYCLEGHAARVTGIGERVDPFQVDRTLWLIIVQPSGRSLSTREVFDRYRRCPYRGVRVPTREVVTALRRGDLPRLSTLAANRLQKTALIMVPEMIRAAEDLWGAGAAFVQMSGSGCAVFGAFGAFPHALRAYRTLKKAHSTLFLTRTLNQGSPS